MSIPAVTPHEVLAALLFTAACVAVAYHWPAIRAGAHRVAVWAGASNEEPAG